MAKKRRYKKRKQKINIDIAVVGMIVVSVLLAVLIYTQSGYLGKNLSPMLGGLIGSIKYIIPVGTFLIAIHLACDDKDYLGTKLIQYLVFLVCVCVIMAVYELSRGNLNLNDTFSQIMNQAYLLGEKNIGGGAIGALVMIPFAKLLGPLGAVILAVGMAIILLIFLFGIKPAELIASFVEEAKERKEERLEELEIEQEEKEKAQALARKKRKQAPVTRDQKKKKRSSIDIPLDEEDVMSEIDEGQITIHNLGVAEEKKAGRRKAKHALEVANEKIEPDVIEANLFATEQETKEEKTKEVLKLEHALTVEDENYEFPPIQLLSRGELTGMRGSKKAITDNATRLQKTLHSFGVSAKVENVSVGPAITRYELKPAEGVRVSKIANLADDIALNLAAASIRIEAPIPGKQAVGIEVPNKENEVVHLRDILDTREFAENESKLSVGLGKDVAGNVVVADIAKMPHLLVAGSTGSGKSVCINTLISSIIYKAKPSEVKLVMVDPKVVELSVYNGIPHLLIPVVTDPKKAAGALAWAVQEMENRYQLFSSKGVRDIKGYNKALGKNDGAGKLPHIVIIIDELADLMMVAAKDVEDAICRLAQKARAAGMHLVIATQRPSVDVITGLIKANVPSRIAFAVSSQVDSRTILDMAGAEKLLGKGDMLFYPTGVPKPTRVQGAFVSDKEVEKIVDFLKANGEVHYSEDVIESIEKANTTDKELKEQELEDDADPFLQDAIETVIETGQASTSFIQRRFKVGYARAGRIMDQMEERGIISGYQGSKPREVLMSKERWAELKMNPSDMEEETTSVEE